MDQNFDTLIPTRQSLLSRLKNCRDEESWRVFFETYWKLIYNTAVKAGLTNAEAEDVVQETVISVLKKMPSFKYDPQKGSFKGWLFQLTHWRILDQFRKRQKKIQLNLEQTSTSIETDPLEQIADPQLEIVWDKEWEKNLIEAAAERVKKKINPAQYQMFNLYFFKKWPVSKIAKTLKVSSGKVYLAKHRISKLLKKEINHLKSEPI